MPLNFRKSRKHKKPRVGSDGFWEMPEEENWFHKEDKDLRVTVMPVTLTRFKYLAVVHSEGNKVCFWYRHTKEGARGTANRWMKAHPNGLEDKPVCDLPRRK